MSPAARLGRRRFALALAASAALHIVVLLLLARPTRFSFGRYEVEIIDDPTARAATLGGLGAGEAATAALAAGEQPLPATPEAAVPAGSQPAASAELEVTQPSPALDAGGSSRDAAAAADGGEAADSGPAADGSTPAEASLAGDAPARVDGPARPDAAPGPDATSAGAASDGPATADLPGTADAELDGSALAASSGRGATPADSALAAMRLDAGRTMASSVDAGGAITAAATKGPDGGPGAGAGGGKSTLRLPLADLLPTAPGGARVVAVLHFDRLRDTPVRDVVEQVLRLFPDYGTLFEGTGLDLMTDIDSLLVATANPYSITATFLAARHHLPPARLRRALAHAPAGTVSWHKIDGVHVGERKPRALPGTGRRARDNGQRSRQDLPGEDPRLRDPRILVEVAPDRMAFGQPALRDALIAGARLAATTTGANRRQTSTTTADPKPGNPTKADPKQAGTAAASGLSPSPAAWALGLGQALATSVDTITPSATEPSSHTAAAHRPPGTARVKGDSRATGSTTAAATATRAPGPMAPGTAVPGVIVPAMAAPGTAALAVTTPGVTAPGTAATPAEVVAMRFTVVELDRMVRMPSGTLPIPAKVVLTVATVGSPEGAPSAGAGRVAPRQPGAAAIGKVTTAVASTTGASTGRVGTSGVAGAGVTAAVGASPAAARLELRLDFGSDQQAQTFADGWPGLVEQVRSITLLHLLGVPAVLDQLRLSRVDKAVECHADLSVAHLATMAGVIRLATMRAFDLMP